MIADSGGNPKAAGPVNRCQGAGAADSPYAGGSAHPPALPGLPPRAERQAAPPPRLIGGLLTYLSCCQNIFIL